MLFAAELLVLSLWLDGDRLSQSNPVLAAMRSWGPSLLRYSVGFCAVFAGFATLGFRQEIASYSRSQNISSPAWSWFAAHAASIALFTWLSAQLYSDAGTTTAAMLWLSAGIFAIASGALALLPWRAWRTLLSITGHTYFYAAIVAGAAILVTNPSRALWEPVSQLTFHIARAILLPLLPGTITQPEVLRIRAPHFGVILAPECSGLEGVGLVLAFCSSWLWLFRKDFRFPQALLLLPVGAVVIYALNIVRIVVLVLIGNAGAKQIAIGGFHSQAGWIAFNAVALGFAAVASRIPYVSRHPAKEHPDLSHTINDTPSRENPTAALLLPFLAIMAAGIVGTMTSSGFEWLYPLRLVAAGTALIYFRHAYKNSNLDWRPTWWGPAAGLVVLLIWIVMDRILEVPDSSIPPTLALAAPLQKWLWISIRFFSGAVTVPLAEELAFRGYLLRRLSSEDFENVTRTSLTAVIVSSLAFGALHGQRWFAGILAGLVYALVLRNRNKIGDAVIAHSVTNLLLGISVLGLEKWQYW